MQKIPTIFERDWFGDRSRVLDQPAAGCEWVFDGEGRATRKYDGTCVFFNGTSWFARREVRAGKPTPPGFVVSGEDETTGKIVGWEPVEQSPFVKFHAEALDDGQFRAPGTYELCGPKVQGNPERCATHTLVRHLDAEPIDVPSRDYPGIRDALAEFDIEGIVFHHPDGRMAKIKGRDFGLKRPEIVT